MSSANKKSLLEIGSAAPDFELRNEKNEIWRLSAHLGKVVALLFYPQNETLVCTKQLCAVRDNWTDYLATKAVVVGVSPGTVAEHQQFAQKHRLPLPLLADANREVTKIYGSHQWMPIWLTRAIVIIDAKGVVRSRSIMLRAFRETDYSVIAAIYRARTDVCIEKRDELLQTLHIKTIENEKAAKF